MRPALRLHRTIRTAICAICLTLRTKTCTSTKNHVKREEAAAEKRLDFQLLKQVNRLHRSFSDCLYCDARLDTYRTIRACENFFLASDGSYTGAVEQIAEEQAAKSERSRIRSALQLDVLQRDLHSAEDTLELQYNAAEESRYSRLTVLPIDWDKNGRLHHFILAFETIRLNADQAIDPKEQLTLYYEQLKQSILENDSYVDALLDMAGTIYTVNLTRDTLERNISPAGKSDSDRALFLDYPLPCAYRDYCDEYRKRVTPATLGSYRTADTSARLLKRFAAGEKHITVEYCVQEDDGAIRWVQKTVLMTQTTVFDGINAETPMVTAIILLQDTSQMHARDAAGETPVCRPPSMKCVLRTAPKPNSHRA